MFAFKVEASRPTSLDDCYSVQVSTIQHAQDQKRYPLRCDMYVN